MSVPNYLPAVSVEKKHQRLVSKAQLILERLRDCRSIADRLSSTRESAMRETIVCTTAESETAKKLRDYARALQMLRCVLVHEVQKREHLEQKCQHLERMLQGCSSRSEGAAATTAVAKHDTTAGANHKSSMASAPLTILSRTHKYRISM